MSSNSTLEIFRAQFHAKTGDSPRMGGVEFVLAEGHISKVLENVRQQSHVESQVKVVMIFQCRTVVTPPHF